MSFTLYCTVLYCTVLYCTVLYCTVLYCTVLYCTVLYCTVLYCTVLYCTVLYCTVLYCTVLYCTVLYCTVLYLLYCTVLYCTGWKKNAPPALIIDNGKAVTAPKDIANILNFKMLEKVSRTIARIQKTDTDPIHNYDKIYGSRKCTFNLQTITMQELRKTINMMKPSRSAGMDGISIRLIKELWKQLEGPILNMVNTSILSKEYPRTLKQSKVIPLLKQSSNPQQPKSPTDTDSYRGINLLMSLGNLFYKIILKQTLHYLIENTLVHHAHHGSIKGRSTTTAVVTLLDTWSEIVENGKEFAAVALNQSSAYNLIDHKILLRKMKYLAFQPDIIKWFSSYISDRDHVLSTEGTISDSLHIGSKSVVQGSVMSCMMYMIYILDLPVIFKQEYNSDPMEIQQEEFQSIPTNQTFVDNVMTTIPKQDNIPLQKTVDETLVTLEEYMRSNRLAVNRIKTQLMVINRDNILKSNVTISAEPDNVIPQTSIKFLGVILSEKLDFKPFLLEHKQNLYTQLQKRISAV